MAWTPDSPKLWPIQHALCLVGKHPVDHWEFLPPSEKVRPPRDKYGRIKGTGTTKNTKCHYCHRKFPFHGTLPFGGYKLVGSAVPEAEKFEDNEDRSCNYCGTTIPHDDWMKSGSFCDKCHDWRQKQHAQGNPTIG